ncbi:MAG: TetR/AcrR family transcriptional regulator [Alphaproteobacteria bacterium]|nr:MAG: TetR/AcrR family transcriptional regulator [Alphaproteobacteria bacterium]
MWVGEVAPRQWSVYYCRMQSLARSRGRGRPSKSESEDIARRIVEAGWSAIIANGYNAASMEAIAEVACVSKRTLYSYYATKSALFEAVFEARLTTWSARSFPDVKRGTMVQSLGTFCRMVVGQLEKADTQAVIKLVLTEATTFTDIGRVFDRHAFGLARSRIIELINSATDACDYDLSRSGQYADALLDTIWGWFSRRAIVGQVPPTSDQTADLLERSNALIRLLHKG